MSTVITKIITALESRLRTDVRYVLSGGSWLIANQIGSFFITFGFLWVFTNFLPKEIYGEYRFITTAASLLAITTLPGMGIAVAICSQR